ncbi:thiol:disulfide interchange protein [Marinifilum breve]|uniref:Thiol:disulfide interchange protein n=1 Tax=Marinifilum breve TaxID=2184082 RepID=A0A2V4A2G7_9BACT|nr:TlpA disulfide reductase family protein [Marinifilum breve]PXY02543.1 thiol:disulfide interchange protein [Marinifilum breve]
MKKNIVVLSLIIFGLLSCVEEYTSADYLKKVVKEMEKIESATYCVEREAWQPGDTSAAFINKRYVESYRNSSDTTIGSSWAIFETEEKTHLEFAYDGKIRTLIYDDVKGIVIDSFKVRKLPFRPVTPPFFNYTENIIKYILENNDSTSLEQNDLGEEVYLKLTIYEDRQVEFFGKAHYMPKNPYTFDPTSIYELWIDKKSNLPRKVRREMSHDISVSSVSGYEFNKQRIKDFVASDFFPKDYEIRQYGQKGKKRQLNDLIGKKAPDWILQNDIKQNISLSDLKSKVLMIQFTSVSCGPCRASIPFLKDLSTEYDKSDFDFVAIESTSKNTNVLKSYMKRNDFDYKFLLSTKDVLNKYSISSFPVFFILDENRIVKKVINGYANEKTDKEIRSLINKMI